jgi:hypothetical protein
MIPRPVAVFPIPIAPTRPSRRRTTRCGRPRNSAVLADGDPTCGDQDGKPHNSCEDYGNGQDFPEPHEKLHREPWSWRRRRRGRSWGRGSCHAWSKLYPTREGGLGARKSVTAAGPLMAVRGRRLAHFSVPPIEPANHRRLRSPLRHRGMPRGYAFRSGRRRGSGKPTGDGEQAHDAHNDHQQLTKCYEYLHSQARGRRRRPGRCWRDRW